MRKRSLAVPGLLAVLLASGARATTSLSLDSGGAISGTPGQTIGWGYTLVNDTNYLVVTGVEFVPAQAFGTFTGFAAQDFRVIGPAPESSSVHEAFDAVSASGIGAIFPFVPTGRTGVGQIVLLYDLYSVSPNDPSFDPLVHTLSVGNQLSATASVSVRAANDADADGLPDAFDNCPFYALLDPTDTDGDGRGNVCECGDQNGDGRNTVSDLVAINLAIFNPALISALCDANGDARCNVADIVATNAEIFSPGNTSTCWQQPVPGP